ncbi:MAG: hypothetical protein R3330_05000, partial [Saprospiraceae bacterium]|nr:hypothetical protein [Saprospiraceae bacterium]
MKFPEFSMIDTGYLYRGSDTVTQFTRFATRLCRNKALFTLTCLVFLLAASLQNTYGQVNGCIEANVGVDGDIYSGIASFGANLPPGPYTNTDDWFLGAAGGEAIMDMTAFPFPDGAPYTWPIQENVTWEWNTMTRTPGTNDSEGNIWIAAVYGRDWNAIGNETDQSTYISQGSEKNGDNPQTWICDPGQVQNKSDIIDYGAHLRLDPNGDLWFFGMMSVVSNSGTRHGDFEFYKLDVTLNPGPSCLGNTGPDGGHSSWQWDGGGLVTSSGDVIFTFDFEKGGAILNPQVWVWVDGADVPANAGDAMGPFTYAGEFHGGDMSGVYGYAKITPVNNNVICTVSNTEDTDAPPYGTIAKDQQFDGTYYPEVTVMELGVNFSAFGFDFSDQDPCELLFGSVYVKTRTSAEFTAELRDGAGPASFGTDLEVTVEATGGQLDCTNNFEVQLMATA